MIRKFACLFVTIHHCSFLFCVSSPTTVIRTLLNYSDFTTVMIINVVSISAYRPIILMFVFRGYYKLAVIDLVYFSVIRFLLKPDCDSLISFQST